MVAKNPGDVLTSAGYNAQIKDNINKLLNQGHRVLTVAQFAALTGIEDGDEAYIEVDSTNGIEWHVRYLSAEPTYKWRFLGGRPLYSEVLASEATTSTTYVALTTGGPSLGVPRVGDYDVTIGSTISEQGIVGAFHSYDIGGTGAVDADAVYGQSSGATGAASSVRTRRKAALTVVTLTSKYRATSAVNCLFASRWMAVVPVRLI